MQDRHCYTLWYNGHAVDYGFLHAGGWMPVAPGYYFACGEFGSEGLDPVDLMYRRYPKAWLPENPAEPCGPWSPREIIDSQTGAFHYMFFDTPDTLDSWVEASQEFQARAVAMMTGAFRREERMNSFALHLFIDAFPAGWMKTIMDCERQPKKAYFTFQDALTPLMVSLRSDRHSYFGGENLVAEAWICNDTSNPVTDAQLRYWLEKDGACIAGGLSPGEADACRPVCQGFIEIALPDSDRRYTAVLHLALVDADNTVLHSTDMEITVYPSPRQVPSRYVCILGGLTPEIQEFAADLHLTPVSMSNRPSGETPILVTDFRAYADDKDVIDGAVRNGAVLLFLDLTEGEYRIGDELVPVRITAMNAVNFVSRQTGHPIVRDFEKNDFSFWFDENLGRISPILSHSFTCAGDWRSILTTGNTGTDGKWGPAMAVAERSFGRGTMRLCQIDLIRRIRTNPAARILSERLMGGAVEMG